MLRIFTLLFCAGIILLQGCSSSKVTQPPPVKLQITEQRPEPRETPAEQVVIGAQADSQALNAENTIAKIKKTKPSEKQKIPEQKNLSVEKKNINSVTQELENPLHEVKQELTEVQTDQTKLGSQATSLKVEVAPNSEIANLDQQRKPPKQIAASVIQIENPWVRTVPPPMPTNLRFSLNLRNESEQL